MGILALVSVTFKASVRIITRSASFVDLGDLTLLTIMLIAAGRSGSLLSVPALAMPDRGMWPVILISFAFLYISGRVMVLLLGIDSMSRKGISAGGAAHSLRKLGKTAAKLSAIPYCLAGALLEELLFRHFLYSAAAGVTRAHPASLLQAAVFAAVHAIPAVLLRHGWRISVYAATFPLLSGLVLQWLYLSSGSAASPAMVHWALNVSAVWRANSQTRQVYDDAR